MHCRFPQNKFYSICGNGFASCKCFTLKERKVSDYVHRAAGSCLIWNKTAGSWNVNFNQCNLTVFKKSCKLSEPGKNVSGWKQYLFKRRDSGRHYTTLLDIIPGVWSQQEAWKKSLHAVVNDDPKERLVSLCWVKYRLQSLEHAPVVFGNHTGFSISPV